MTFSDANPWTRDLTAARELDALNAPTGRRVVLHLSSFDDGGWEDIHVLCPVSLIRCSQDVLWALKGQLDREIFAKSCCYVDCGEGFVQLSYVQSDATPLADNKYGRIVEGIYFGNEFINLGLALPVAYILLGKMTDLNSAVKETAERNEHLFELLAHTIGCRSLKLLNQLLAACVPCNARSHHGFTPLFAACHQGDLEAIQLLLNYEADPNARNADGYNALEYTLTLIPFTEEDRKRDRDGEVIRLLASAGATADLDVVWRGVERLHEDLERDLGHPPGMWMSRTREEMIDLLRQAGIAAS